MEDTDRNWFSPQTDGRKGRADGRTTCNEYTPFQIRWTGVPLDIAKNTELQ